jgi:hypothetical protein
MDLKEIRWEVWTECNWLRIGSVAVSCEHGSETSGFIKGEEFLD